MALIKICGLRRLEDALMVNEGHPDFAGFILTPSKRQVTIEQAGELSGILLTSIRRVGVFAKETPEEIAQAAAILALDGIQLHFDTTVSFMADLRNQLGRYPYEKTPFLWQRLPVPSTAISAEDVLAGLGAFPELTDFDGLLLDTFHAGKDGGTGKTFPWKPAIEYIRKNNLTKSRIIVAGGLTLDNVADAAAFFNPYAVDVSSGVESDGYKDREKVLRFIQTVRKAQV